MRGKAAGFTLVEVVIAISILVIALSAALALYSQGVITFQSQQTRIEVQENARIALDRLVRELRTASTIDEINPTSVAITLSDGKKVRYYHDAARQQLMREVGGGVNPVASFIKDLRLESDPPNGAGQHGLLLKITLVVGDDRGNPITFHTSVFIR